MTASLFSEATTWLELRNGLVAQGLDLKFEAGRLILVETSFGTKICSCRYLGYSLAVLSRRLGRLRLRASGSDDFQITNWS
ncbi:hypothetical protein [Primorskyibacter sp. S187A]|uniref:hypothetical protein n=1 Tax=Primorskyibacter sp. S187A TaxID=3415130 RepID=UPI003C7CA263